MAEEIEVIAILGSNRQSKSIRQEKLPEEAVHLLAFLFSLGCSNAAEIRLDNPIDNVIYGGKGKFHSHSGSDSLRYFSHRDDPEWAVVFEHDCFGDAEKGEAIFERIKREKLAKESS